MLKKTVHLDYWIQKMQLNRALITSLGFKLNQTSESSFASPGRCYPVVFTGCVMKSNILMKSNLNWWSFLICVFFVCSYPQPWAKAESLLTHRLLTRGQAPGYSIHRGQRSGFRHVTTVVISKSLSVYFGSVLPPYLNYISFKNWPIRDLGFWLIL